MFLRFLRTISLVILMGVLVIPSFALGQEDCGTKEECEALLKEYEAEIEKLGAAVAQTEQKERTIQNQINLLRSRIQQLDLQIQQGNVMIKDISYQIGDTEESITQTSLKILDSKDKLVSILRVIYEEDQKSLVEVLFYGNTLSSFFDNLMSLETLNLRSQEFLGEIKSLKSTLEEQKETLDGEKVNLERVVQLQYAQKQENQTNRNEQEYFLKLTEAEKLQYLVEKEKVEKAAAEIRAKIIELVGVPIGEVPEFGELLKIAQSVSSVAGIRPAFLLAVISQESALGRNIGQCYVTNKSTGGGVYISSGNPVNRIMNSTRDLPIFLRLTGDKFNTTPVSCWIPMCYLVGARTLTLTDRNIYINGQGVITCPSGYAPYGFGGAMGPAQFIPSTWQLYEGKLRNLFGISSPSPWVVRDALAASALMLAEKGATYKTRAAEIAAANSYFGGSYSGYGNQVLSRADCVQSFIDTNTMSQTCQNTLGLRLR